MVILPLMTSWNERKWMEECTRQNLWKIISKRNWGKKRGVNWGWISDIFSGRGERVVSPKARESFLPSITITHFFLLPCLRSGIWRLSRFVQHAREAPLRWGGEQCCEIIHYIILEEAEGGTCMPDGSDVFLRLLVLCCHSLLSH